MRKLFLVTFVILATFAASFAQTGSTASGADDNIPNMGRAPKEPNGIGRLDLRVVDDAGSPVKGVHAFLESHRTDGYRCESWNWTDARGVAVLPPLHMGRLVLKLKAPGFQTQKIEVPASSLNEPVRVTMVRKS